jgi:hypothetical protein
MDDVIGQGREPDRDPRLPLPRHWRIGGGILLAVAAGLAVIVLAPRHPATGTAPAVTPTPSSSAQIEVRVLPPSGIAFPTLPLPRNNAVIVVCSPSTGACSVRLNVRELKSEYRAVKS